MISINDLISLQNEKEKAGFIQYLERRNKRHDAKNISLYTDFLNGNDKRLLKEINANSYNALKKRHYSTHQRLTHYFTWTKGTKLHYSH
jgi:hypothetical protein